jgi:phosphoribosylformylglycinamidine synthase PurS subunit
MARHIVNVYIENKPYISDPEGDTILKDLVIKGGYSNVKSIRVAKMLRFEVDADDIKEAEGIVRMLCDELRLYNPVLSVCRVVAEV